MNVPYCKKIALIFLALLSIPLIGMEMNLNEIPKHQAEPESLNFTLEGQAYTFSLEPILKHITRYQKSIDHTGKDKLLGFHYYKPREIKEHSSGITLSIVQDNLWVLAFGDIKTFHKGYVIYQGKAFPKTFFPTSWDKDSIGAYLTRLSTAGKHSLKIKDYSDGLTKTYAVTLTDTNGQVLSYIIHGCPLIPQSMRLVTIYPILKVAEHDDLSLLATTLTCDQMKKLQDKAKVHTPNRELIEALQKKDSERAHQLLSLDADANVHDSKGKTALMHAATTGDWTLVNTLLEYGADPLVQDNDGNMAFHYALESGDYFTALGLINPSFINKANKLGNAPLSIALKNKNIEALELLLQFKATITVTDTFGRTPLMLAVKAYQSKTDLAFCKAALTLLLQAGADINAQDKGGNTALHYAVESCSLELVQLLINAHASLSLLNVKKETALTLAKKLYYTPIVELIENLEKEKQEWLKESKGTELMYAIKTENIFEVKKLLEKGIDVNAQDSSGWTALTCAIEKGNSSLVTLLLNAGADPRIKLSSGYNLLAYAQGQENNSIIQALESKRAELDAPLKEQKQKEQEYLKACLTKFKSDLDKDELSRETTAALPFFIHKVLNPKTGYTPLLYAVNEKKYRVIKQLLEHNTNIITARDSKGKDALALAYTHGDLEALRILLLYSSHSRSTELLVQALTDNNNEVTKLLCTQVSGLAYQALIKALREGNQALVSKLVTQPLTSKESGQICIIALEKGNSDAARLIIKSYPKDLLKELLAYKDGNGMTLLMHSIHYNFTEIAQLLVEAGADALAVDAAGKTAKDYTSSKSSLYQYLLAQEQSVEQTKKQTQEKEAKEQLKRELQQKGWAELAIAVSIDDAAYVKAYQGNDINIVTPEGTTPLLIAAKNNNENLVSLLLSKPGINVNARNKDGYTALMYAALNENNGIVAQLLKHGAHPCICNNQRKTALDLIKSKKNGFQLIIKSLQEAQEKVITPYLDKINELDENMLKELRKILALPIAFPSLYLTPAFIISMIILSKDLQETPSTIELLRQTIDNPQTLQSCINITLTLLASQQAEIEVNRYTSIGTISVNGTTIARLLLNIGPDVNFKDDLGNTSLIYASELGYTNFVKLLLDAKADVNARNKSNDTALTFAAQKGHTDVVELLLAHPAINVNIKNNSNRTPLDFAATEGHTDIVQLLLNAKAKINAKNSVGQTALFLATLNGHKDTVKLLLESNANPNEPDTEGTASLMLALKNKHNDIVKLLIDYKADVNACNNKGITPLMIAANTQNNEAVKLLIEKGVNVNYRGKEGWPALFHGLRDTLTLKLLLDAGADVNIRDNDGRTALMFASKDGIPEIIRPLLKAGANANEQDTNGLTPLMHAMIVKDHNNRIEAVKMLLEGGASVSIQNQTIDKVTSLMYAAAGGYTEIVMLLLNAGANLDTQNKWGKTALMAAIAREDIPLVEILVGANADLNLKDIHGKTALNYAQESENIAIINLLMILKHSKAAKSPLDILP